MKYISEKTPSDVRLLCKYVEIDNIEEIKNLLNPYSSNKFF